ncbi:hypothetical protein ABZ621_31745 [Streptomyces sp. NPDC007863]|uniref:hypothetical protein n=1 Tax=Streptomyces sp. NPDC007863 TaxID=3154894 RepID=UPI0033F12377
MAVRDHRRGRAVRGGLPRKSRRCRYLPGNQALVPRDTVNARRPEYDRVTVWAASWIPVASHGVGDRTSGLYLEDVADMREAPALATRDKPGLVGGALVWGSSIDPAREDRWRPLVG